MPNCDRCGDTSDNIVYRYPQMRASLFTWFQPGLENLEKWKGIFQSGKNQGILSRLEKSGNFTQNTGKIRKNDTEK